VRRSGASSFTRDATNHAVSYLSRGQPLLYLRPAASGSAPSGAGLLPQLPHPAVGAGRPAAERLQLPGQRVLHLGALQRALGGPQHRRPALLGVSDRLLGLASRLLLQLLLVGQTLAVPPQLRELGVSLGLTAQDDLMNQEVLVTCRGNRLWTDSWGWSSPHLRGADGLLRIGLALQGGQALLLLLQPGSGVVSGGFVVPPPALQGALPLGEVRGLFGVLQDLPPALLHAADRLLDVSPLGLREVLSTRALASRPQLLELRLPFASGAQDGLGGERRTPRLPSGGRERRCALEEAVVSPERRAVGPRRCSGSPERPAAAEEPPASCWRPAAGSRRRSAEEGDTVNQVLSTGSKEGGVNSSSSYLHF